MKGSRGGRVSHLAYFHGGGLFQVAGRGEDHADVAELVALDGVGLDELTTVLDDLGVDSLVPLWVARLVRPSRQTYIHVRRGFFVHVKPNIFRPCVFDELFVFMLVSSHVEEAAFFRCEETF